MNSADPVIEPASAADIPALSALLSVLFAQEVEFTPDDRAQRNALETIISNPHLGAILVARDGANILAMVNLLFTVSTAIGQRVAILEDMVVAPQARGSGTGSTLLRRAIEFARSQGVKRITLLTDRENLSAHRFYSRHGFTESSMIPFRISLA